MFLRITGKIIIGRKRFEEKWSNFVGLPWKLQMLQK
jgi:hypothetical protein